MINKTVTIKELYSFIKGSNMWAYIESEAALIRMLRKMTEGRSATTVSFFFVTPDSKEFTYTINVKDLEN